MKLKQARKLNIGDFLSAFGDVPTSFVSSFYKDEMVKRHLNLPSSVLKAQIDTKTMRWKDMDPVNQEDLSFEML